MYKIVYTKSALKDVELIKKSKFQNKVKKLIDILRNDPFTEYPSYEKLRFNLEGSYSRRINIQHRLVYQVYEEEKIVKILSIWIHYDE